MAPAGNDHVSSSRGMRECAATGRGPTVLAASRPRAAASCRHLWAARNSGHMQIRVARVQVAASRRPKLDGNQPRRTGQPRSRSGLGTMDWAPQPQSPLFYLVPRYPHLHLPYLGLGANASEPASRAEGTGTAAGGERHEAFGEVTAGTDVSDIAAPSGTAGTPIRKSMASTSNVTVIGTLSGEADPSG